MKNLVLILLCVLLNSSLIAQEAQWRGPDRNGRYPGSGLLNEWPEEGPEMILNVGDMGAGFSSPIYYDSVIYITGKKGDAALAHEQAREDEERYRQQRKAVYPRRQAMGEQLRRILRFKMHQ